VVATLRETISPRLTLVQFVSRSGGQTSIHAGGHFLSNPVSIGIDYQTVYAPFRLENPFVQSAGFNLRLQSVAGVQLQVATYTTPDGRTRYTVSGSHLLYRFTGGATAQAAAGVLKAAKYIVRGHVVDDKNRPVAGAVLRIGGALALTSEDGRFFVRTRKPTACSLQVVVEEFLAPGHFQVVSAPKSVTPATEDQAREITITVRRIERPQRMQ
jgi:hypothetical protein